MRRSQIILWTILLSLILIGCTEKIDPNFKGKFTYQSNPKIYVEIDGYGGFFVWRYPDNGKGSEVGYKGSYKLKNNMVIVNLPQPDNEIPEFRNNPIELKLEGDALIGLSGSRFVKQGGSNATVVQTESDNGKLTQGKAQRALNKWGGADGEINVLGIHEIPSENRAVGDLKFNNYKVKSRSVVGGVEERNYSGNGKAEFVHYNDGRWILSKVTIGQGFDAAWWDNINIEAK